MLFRQVFDGLEAGRDGLVTVGVVDGKVAFLSSSLTTDTSVTNEVVLSPEEAVRAAAQAAGQPAGSVSNLRSENGWLVLDVKGYTDPARARLVGAADTHGRRAPGLRGPADGRRRRGSNRRGELHRRRDRRAATARRNRRLCGRQPGVEGVRSLPADRLLDDRHPRALVLDNRALGPRLPAGGRQQRIAGAVGRRCGAGHAVVPHARQQRAGDAQVVLERRQRTGHRLRSLGDPRLRVPVDEPVVRGEL